LNYLDYINKLKEFSEKEITNRFACVHVFDSREAEYNPGLHNTIKEFLCPFLKEEELSRRKIEYSRNITRSLTEQPKVEDHLENNELNAIFYISHESEMLGKIVIVPFDYSKDESLFTEEKFYFKELEKFLIVYVPRNNISKTIFNLSTLSFFGQITNFTFYGFNTIKEAILSEG